MASRDRCGPRANTCLLCRKLMALNKKKVDSFSHPANLIFFFFFLFGYPPWPSQRRVAPRALNAACGMAVEASVIQARRCLGCLAAGGHCWAFIPFGCVLQDGAAPC